MHVTLISSYTVVNSIKITMKWIAGFTSGLMATITCQKIGTLKRTCVYCECDLKSEQPEVNVSNQK